MYFFVIIFIFGAVFGNKKNAPNEDKLWDTAGDFPQPAIIDGYVATLEEFPYAARLYTFRGREIGSCTAEIITPEFLMTAAHCAAHKAFMVVVAGKADQTDYVEGRNLDDYVRYRVIRAYVHPLYSRMEAKHDVAIIELAKPMSHSGFRTLPISFERLRNSTQGIIYGWGGTLKTAMNSQLYAKNLSVKPCTKKEDRGYEYICLMEPGSKKGDSGGPIIIDGKLRGVCSHTQISDESPTKENYYYIALWEEKEFLERVLNAANYNRCFIFLITMSFIFIF